ncbi:MAG: phosphotransferase [Candidatus Moraniibacteriota bacterium]
MEEKIRLLLLEVDNLDLRKQWRKRIMEGVENEEVTPDEAYAQLEVFVERRFAALFSLFSLSHDASDAEREGLRNAIRYIRELQKDPSKNLIGSGNVASVQSLLDDPEHCMKIVRNFGSVYTSGNDVRKETHLLDELSDLQAANIRTPEPLAFIKTDSLHGIVMERLNAVSIKDIVEQQLPVPETFDFQEFFSRIRQYLNAMHERRIFHRDLHWGNIMVNLETNEGFVIDFGTGIDLSTTSTGAKADLSDQENTLADVDEAILSGQTIAPLKKYLKEELSRALRPTESSVALDRQQ